MKTFAHTVCAVCLLAVRAWAGLSAGDIAIVAYNSDSPDALAWVALANIPSNTVINFTDSSVNNGLFYWPEHLVGGSQELGNGGPLVWKHNRDVTPGTVVRFDSAAGAWSVGAVSNHYPKLSVSGDQLFAYTGSITQSLMLPGDYQGDPYYATMLYGIDFGNGGWTNLAGTSFSSIPTGISTGAFTAVYTDARDNGYYSGIVTGSVAELRQAIANPANWTTSDSYLDPSLWPKAFEVLPGTLLLEFSQRRVRRGASGREGS